MKTTGKIGLSLAAGAGAAAFTYVGFAATAWLRYGHHKELDKEILLDGFMPEPEVIEHHEVRVSAPAPVVFEAAKSLDLMESRLAKLIFATREAVMCAPRVQDELPKGLIGQVKAMGWRVLDEAPGNEIVIGAAAKPWLADPEFHGIDGGEFAAFGEPGWAKIAWNFAVERVNDTTSILKTETRVVTTDKTSRRLFRRYWAVASPGIALIRRLGLRIVKHDAENAFARPIEEIVPAV